MRGVSDIGASPARTEIQPHEDALGVREIADDLLDRFRQLAHQRWDRQNLVAARELRVFQQIDNLDAVPAGQMLFANAPEVVTVESVLFIISILAE